MVFLGTSILDNTDNTHVQPPLSSYNLIHMHVGKMDDLTIWYHVFAGV